MRRQSIGAVALQLFPNLDGHGISQPRLHGLICEGNDLNRFFPGGESVGGAKPVTSATIGQKSQTQNRTPEASCGILRWSANHKSMLWLYLHVSVFAVISCSTVSGSAAIRISFARRLHLLFERDNPLLCFCRVRRVGIQQLDFVVINQRAVPLLLFFVELRDLETAARLFAFKRGDYFIGLRNARIIRV